jgi:hypothetical protein
MKIDGQCHCGFIRYEAEINPQDVEVCHCKDCQILSGSAFRVVVPAAAENFRMLGGQPKTYTKTAANSTLRNQAFCPECGTPIYGSAANEVIKFYGIRAGTIRQRDQLVPQHQYWMGSAVPWLDSLPRIPKTDGN